LVFILNKIHTSLVDEGFFVSKHWHIDDYERDLTAVYFDLMFSITEEQERLYSTGDFLNILESVGFSIERVHVLNNTSHSSRIIIAKKV